LIRIPRSDIEDYEKKYRIGFCEDKTNSETVYSRNKIRHNIIPEILKVNSGAVSNASRSSEILRAESDYLQAQAKSTAENIAIADDACKVEGLLSAHPALFGRVCEIFAGRAAKSDAYVLEYCHIAAIFALCESASPSGEICLPDGIVARREYEKLIFERGESKDKPTAIMLCEGEHFFGDYRVFVKKSEKTGKIHNSVNTFLVSCGRIQDGLLLRSRQPGDEIKLPKRPAKSLKKLFIEKRIPKNERDYIPVIADGNNIVTVYGAGTDERYLPGNGEEIFVIEISKGCWDNEK
ncbi:MAG: tRNA lysidine(34) synthetase TilS, partial [Oscillospiraceae bacterium]|nr:tRNA lysidine(34) synthetase TilS [Oscillospiraceae bacterium]